MTSIAKPKIVHQGLKRNALGLTVRDYEGGMSTLCAGCGHDSITAAIVQAFFELDIAPHSVAKMSGIGCSSKTPAYFLERVARVQLRARPHAVDCDRCERREPRAAISSACPATATRCRSGSGSSCTRCAAISTWCTSSRTTACTASPRGSSRRRPTSARRRSAARSTSSRRSTPCRWRLALGGSFVARSFSGDKDQLVPLIKAGVRHRGFALIDVVSPCVTFNDHEDSTKSYAHAREFNHPAIHADFVPPAAEIKAAYDEGDVLPVELHDGSRVLLRKVAKDYDASNRGAAIEYIRARHRGGEIVTGLLYIDETRASTCTASTAPFRCRSPACRTRSCAPAATRC